MNWMACFRSTFFSSRAKSSISSLPYTSSIWMIAWRRGFGYGGSRSFPSADYWSMGALVCGFRCCGFVWAIGCDMHRIGDSLGIRYRLEPGLSQEDDR